MGSMTRALARTVATGLVVGMGLLGGAASAQTDELVIAEPANRTVVTEGEMLSVRGTGCEPGSFVHFIAYDEPLGRTTAADDGSFDGELRAPTPRRPDDDASEPYEVHVRVQCDDAEADFVLVNQPPEAADDSTGRATEDQLAYTGTEADLAVAGVAAVLGGALLLVGSSRARRRADADGASRA